MIVGEAPGDQEDLQGKPFVGPAGQLLRQSMQKAGIDPDRAWLTNAVKHFASPRAASAASTRPRMPAISKPASGG